MFGYYQRPIFYRRTPSLFDEMFNLERSIRRQNQIEKLLFPELFLPRMFYIIKEQQAKDGNEEDSKTNKEDVKISEKKEEQKETKQTETEEIKKEEEIKQDPIQPETEKETELINKEQKEEEIKENPIEKEEKETKQNEDEKEIPEQKQKQEAENEDEKENEIPEHELDDENFSIETKIITKNNGKFKHIFREEKGLTTGITKSIETRTIGDKSMSLTRISFPDGKIDEHEDRQNINNDEEFEAFKNEWISAFPIKAQPIKQETQ